MKDYEIITILPNESGVLEQAKKDVLEILKRNSVQVVKEADWGVRKLASAIDRTESAHFTLYSVKVDPAKVATLNHEFGLQLNILRYMVKRAA